MEDVYFVITIYKDGDVIVKKTKELLLYHAQNGQDFYKSLCDEDIDGLVNLADWVSEDEKDAIQIIIKNGKIVVPKIVGEPNITYHNNTI